MADFFIPKNLDDINTLRDTGEAECSWLEFKSGKLFSGKFDKVCNTLSVQITAFANSAGGIILLGVDENSDRTISALSPITDLTITEDRLESALLSRINPPASYSITRIPCDDGSIFVISIPQSFNGPHQASDKKYYARRQFRVDPLLPYEIDDIRRRIPSDQSVATVSMFARDGSIFFKIINKGDAPIFDVRFGIIGIENREIANSWRPALDRPYLSPFRKISPREERTFLGSGYEFFSEKLNDDFTIFIKYRDEHGYSYTHQEVYYLQDLVALPHVASRQEKQFEDLVDEIKKINRNLSEVSSSLKRISELAVHPSGLALSKTSLTALGASENLKWPGWALDYRAIAEILEIDESTALKITHTLFASHNLMGGENKCLDEIDVSEEVKARIRSRLANL